MLCGRRETFQALRYRAVEAEIIRGVLAVSGLTATPGGPGWVALHCESTAQARWLAEAIERENVQASYHGDHLLVPVAADYRIDVEVKSVITVVAKTTDYWYNHMPTEVRRTLEISATLGALKSRVAGWLWGHKKVSSSPRHH